MTDNDTEISNCIRSSSEVVFNSFSGVLFNFMNSMK